MPHKKFAIQIFIWSLLISSVAFSIIDLGKANFAYGWVKDGEVPVPEGTPTPKILFFSPKNDAFYTSSNIPLIFNVSAPKMYRFMSLYYKASWQPNDTQIHQTYIDYVNINLTDVPEGSHFLEVKAVWVFLFESHVDPNNPYMTHYTSYSINGSATVYFNVDLPPKISIISIENKTYRPSIIPLDFTVNEPISKATYSLDGQDNVTITGNTTLTNVPNGDHTVTVYAMDETGNTASQTIYFTIAEPFPVVPVAAASGVSITGVAVCLLYYRKKRNH